MEGRPADKQAGRQIYKQRKKTDRHVDRRKSQSASQPKTDIHKQANRAVFIYAFIIKSIFLHS